MDFAVETGNRHYADRILLWATRWPGRHYDGEDDAVVRKAREQLCAEFPAVH